MVTTFVSFFIIIACCMFTEMSMNWKTVCYRKNRCLAENLFYDYDSHFPPLDNLRKAKSFPLLFNEFGTKPVTVVEVKTKPLVSLDFIARMLEQH